MSFDIEEIYLLSTVLNEDMPEQNAEFNPSFASKHERSATSPTDVNQLKKDINEQPHEGIKGSEELFGHFGKIEQAEQFAAQLKNSILLECKRMIDDMLVRQKER
ncbi:hypothetical protein [Spartinivicinus poritis]|uniref:Uncharacterized protein n=1 Tax=Spartinivicinus poritis TaxID=2994640 RepID=A0ABT5U2T0_9GAMM|nr:hypothetical protein [Spartinivicinus sp. A2-2]MDE1460668.1 hypothetical protein [Spartinivicinus sp. A2-2]